jgi:O-Antigen ligase
VTPVFTNANLDREMLLVIVLPISLLAVTRPVWGYYVFVASAVVIDLYLWNFHPWTSGLSRYFYGLWNDVRFEFFGLGNWISTVDVLLVALTIGCVVRRDETNRGYTASVPCVLLLLSVLFLGFVGAMVLYGVGTGGDVRVAIWQVRPYLYLIWLALLTPAVLRTRSELIGALAILVGATMFKASQIIWIFVVDAGAKFGEWREILGHEDSLFIVGAISLIGALAILRVSPRGARFLFFLCAPILLLALTLNLRRAGYVAFVLSAVLALFVFRRAVRAMLKIMVPLLLVCAAYSILFWNSDAPLAMPIQKVKSIMFNSAGTADAGSNLYRVVETSNLLQSIRNHPFGLGFGHAFETAIKLPDVSAIVPNWQYFPHDVFLGLWAFLGPAGLALFLFYLSSLLAFASQSLRNEQGGIQSMRNEQDGVLQSITFFIMSTLASAIVMGTVDQFVWAQRGAIFLGAVLGMLFVVDRLIRSGEGRRTTPHR